MRDRQVKEAVAMRKHAHMPAARPLGTRDGSAHIAVTGQRQALWNTRMAQRKPCQDPQSALRQTPCKPNDRTAPGRAAPPEGRPPMAMYVVQVMGGRERHVATLIDKIRPDAIEECFTPSFELMKRRGGAWRRETDILFPGYLFIVSSDATRAYAQLRAIPAFTRLLGSHDDGFTPLTPDEMAWLEAFTTVRGHVVPMSTAVIEGDRVIVTDGPLKGHEALISKIDRHKRLAFLDMRIFGRNKTIKVGLEVVRKRVAVA